MMLVDKEKVIEAIEDTDWYHINKNGELTSGANSTDDIPLYKSDDIYKAVDSVKSVDAQPVRHGKWKKIRGAINCSVCKNSNWSMSFEGLVMDFNYCPNCGAKMDGDKYEID